MARGGKRSGAGRKLGVPNKASREVKELAREYTGEALLALAHVLRDKDAPASARVSAAVALLDRGHGRPAQQIDAEIVFSVEQQVAMLSPAERLSRLRELTHKARLMIEGQVVEI